MYHNILKSFSLLALSAVSLVAESWTPYMARFERTETITGSSGEVLQEIRRIGTEKRASNGDLLVVWDGSPQLGQFQNAATGEFVEIDFTQRRARVRTSRGVTGHWLKTLKDQPLGSKNINGQACTEYPQWVHLNEDGSKRKQVGSWCIDVANEIVFLQDATYDGSLPGAGGRSRHVRMQRTNVQMNYEFKPGEVGVPGGFVIDSSTKSY